MPKKKIVSIRLSEELLESIEKYLCSRPYQTRSSVIEKCVCAVLRCASDKDRHLILDTYDPFAEGVVIWVAN